VADGTGTGRRDLLKKALSLGALAPMAGIMTRPLGATHAPPVTQRLAALSSQQLAGQRVIYSYPGLTVPAARPGRRSAELGRLHRRGPAGDRPPVQPLVPNNEPLRPVTRSP
jgi:hypothetical protein